MTAQEVTRVAAELIERGGVRLTDEDIHLLGTPANALAARDEKRLEEMSMAVLKGFFDAAASGHALVPLSLIEKRFGRTLEENYPEAGEAFLRFARAYWSLKMVTDSQADTSWAYQCLLQIERIIGPLFFPFPGPAVVDPARRESDQREILREFGAKIDIEDFISHNPILIRDRGGRKGGGCLGSIMCIFGILGFLMYLTLRLASSPVNW